MAMEHSSIWMAPIKKVSGAKISSVGKVKSIGKTGAFIKVVIKTEKKVEEAHTHYPASIPIKEIGAISNSMATELSNGRMVNLTTDNGNLVAGMEKEHSHGNMGVAIAAHMLRI